ncbi:DUF1353 domain-containing protein [Rhodococcus sp. HM1]|uniref:DUF1353 domain-containing protein n=1 Tax=Rhodococcus sp. HM1 TaxID=2937759 RepID=UPI00200B9F6D|nr:DUF1353 domain-containing protein [Rhodococcus sp. HM1]MCK8674522.1 DUF1353 domain-containing protein [Rhodococcus sp. HM1]
MPFIELRDGRWVRKTEVGLRQLAPDGAGSLPNLLMRQFKTTTRFQVLDTFRYTPAVDEDDWQDAPAVENGEQLEVRAQSTSDLASIPPCLWGLIASYGGHTMPALLHDTQCAAARDVGKTDAMRARAMRRRADARFRSTLRHESDAGVVTQWIMWSTVRVFASPPYALLVLLFALVLWGRVATAAVPALPGAGVAAAAFLPCLAAVFIGAGLVSREAAPPGAPGTPGKNYREAVRENLTAAMIVTLILPTILPMLLSTLLTRILLMLADVIGFVVDAICATLGRPPVSGGPEYPVIESPARAE